MPLNTSMALSHFAVFNQNPNLLKRRRSQDGLDQNKKKQTLDFNDLFNLKQKLIGAKAKGNKFNDNRSNDKSDDGK